MRSAVRRQSEAVSPPPITATLRPIVRRQLSSSGSISISTLARIKNSVALYTPGRSSPGTSIGASIRTNSNKYRTVPFGKQIVDFFLFTDGRVAHKRDACSLQVIPAGENNFFASLKLGMPYTSSPPGAGLDSNIVT